MSEAVLEIYKAMDNAEDWDVGAFYLTHRPSGTQFWIANGFLFFKCDGLALGFFNKIKLWRKAKTLRQRIIANKLTAQSITEPQRGQWI